MFELTKKIEEWSNLLREKGSLHNSDIAELESHLHEEIDNLIIAGLTEEEAFLIAVKRIGNTEKLGKEFAKINKNHFWKEFNLYDTDNDKKKKIMKDFILIGILSLITAFLIKIPEFFGYSILSTAIFGHTGDLSITLFYLKNISFFILPVIIIYFFIKKSTTFLKIIIISLIYLFSFLLINFYPFNGYFRLEASDTIILSILHLPIFLWLVTCVAYGGMKWRETQVKMDFLRLTGEAFIYGVLIFCGLLVLTGFTLAIFSNMITYILNFYLHYIFISLIIIIPLVAIFLAEAKKSIIENLAPILAKIFSPLFLITLFAFLIAVIFFKQSPYYDRNFLITSNIILVLVLALVIYIISARKNRDERIFFDYINLGLIAISMVTDLIALSAILFRITSFGISPNKMAALGLNIILFSNLLILLIYYIKFILKKDDFIKLEKYQTFYLFIYAGWTAFVAFVFPLLFNFQ